MKTFPFSQTLYFRFVPWRRPVFNLKEAIGKSSQIKWEELRIGHWPESCTLLPRCKAFRIIHAFWCRFSPTSRLFRWGMLSSNLLKKVWLSRGCLFLWRASVGATGKPVRSAHSQYSLCFIKRLGGGSWGESHGHSLCHKIPLFFIICLIDQCPFVGLVQK